jgi:hypothetical protein
MILGLLDLYTLILAVRTNVLIVCQPVPNTKTMDLMSAALQSHSGDVFLDWTHTNHTTGYRSN